MIKEEISKLVEWVQNQYNDNETIFTDKLMGVSEFMWFVIENHESFNHYCEFLIFPKDDEGRIKISLAVPSHSERLLKYVMEKENLSREEVIDSIPMGCTPLYFLADKYGVAVCWYDTVLLPSDDENGEISHILDALNTLDVNHAIDVVTERYNDEYKKYLYRKSLGMYE